MPAIDTASGQARGPGRASAAGKPDQAPKVDGRALALVGPTAVGKSAVAVALADQWSGPPIEVINADAMQLYRGMTIGTAKVDDATRAAVPHHLLELWDVQHRASVVEYRDAAREAMTQIVARAGLPVLVGGSGLYLSAALDDLQVPATDPAVRARYEALLAEVGAPGLHEQLRSRDPQAAAEISPQNGRRLVRALEVVELTGSFQASLPRNPPQWMQTTWIGLTTDLPTLDAAIDTRVEQMWADGLLAEVAALVPQGLAEGATAPRAVGYQEALLELAGEISGDEARARTAQRTRQLARRQLRWFRRNPRITWWTVPAGDDPGSIAAALAADIAAFLDRQT